MTAGRSSGQGGPQAADAELPVGPALPEPTVSEQTVSEQTVRRDDSPGPSSPVTSGGTVPPSNPVTSGGTVLSGGTVSSSSPVPSGGTVTSGGTVPSSGPVPPGTVIPQDAGPNRTSRTASPFRSASPSRTAEPPDPTPRLVDLELLIVVGCGAAIGALGRWGLAQLIPAGDGLFPWATYLTNVLGSFALGLLVGLAERVWPHTRVPRLFLGVGVLGGFTTFSTAMVESVLLVDAGRAGLAFAYLTGSLIACLAAAVIGMVIAGAVESRAGRAAPTDVGSTIVDGGADRP